MYTETIKLKNMFHSLFHFCLNGNSFTSLTTEGKTGEKWRLVRETTVNKSDSLQGVQSETLRTAMDDLDLFPKIKMHFPATFFIVFVVIFLLFLLVYSIYVKLPLEFRYEDRPNLLFLYLRVLRVGYKKNQNSLLNSDLASSQGRIELIAKDCRCVTTGPLV